MADRQFAPAGDKSKLGKISAHPVTLPKGTVGWVFNMYTQYNFGTQKRQLDYEALINCMEELKVFLARPDAQDYKVGMPRIGCGLAGGDWDAVKAIIDYIFPDKDIYVYYL
jgi:O-acetyl-ADP-ribose deacetylase (regulator of RNase III)